MKARDTMIFNNEPKDWRDLQNKVCQVFLEMGCIAEVEKDIDTVRGKVNIDVYVEDKKFTPEMTYLCECKFWNKPVSQNVVHSFQTVVNNAGANTGYIISKNGFQTGAVESATSTNIVLLNWTQFQELLFNRWRKAMFKKAENLSDNFMEYFDFLSGPPRDKDDNAELERLVKKYYIFMTVSPYLNLINSEKTIDFPIKCIDPRGNKYESKEISITNYRDLFEILNESYEAGIKAFTDFRAFLSAKHGDNTDYWSSITSKEI
ncbi:MAG: restriction endonuclease [Ignavibacteriales bacterium]